MTRRATRLPGALLASALAVSLGAALAGCVDKDTVFTNRPGTDQPTETTNNFLGYIGDAAQKQTNCANCHATYQAGWATTGHYEAWEGLGQVPGAQENPECVGCHAISELGNPLTEPAGYNVVADVRYTDVQCESCHGSGWDHVNNPNAANAPLCSITAATDATTGCGECHSGAHHPFVEQWELSAHANVGFASGRDGCNECHEGRKALERKFYDTSNYVEKFGTENQPIVCAVCHDPHGSDFDANLRAPVDVAGDELPSTDHLCFRCHSRQGTPPSYRGAHAAQGLLVLQEDIGWIPAGWDAPDVGSHGNPAVNPTVCVKCHVVMYEIEDEVTEEFQFNTVGHTFEAVVCLDAEGKPDPTLDCDDSERDYRSCTDGCHPSEEGAANLYIFLQSEINRRLDQLWVDSDNDGVVDPTDGGLIPRVVQRAFLNPADTLDLDPRDNLVTVAEGVFWNAQIAHTDGRPQFGGAVFYRGLAGPDESDPPDGVPDGIRWSAHKSSGNGAHNPDFLTQLLDASIEALIEFYGLAP